jgi:CHASE3 domain sensor protein
MRSRAARLTFAAAALILVGLAGAFLIRTETEIASSRTTVRAFDVHAREMADTLADLRFAQQAYVATGQAVGFWMPKVATTTESVKTGITSLRQSAASGPARSALMEAEATIAEFETVDRRARDYIKSGDHLMAADVIFTEGGDTATRAARQVETARIADHQALDANEADRRKEQALALGAAASLVAIIILLLVPVPRSAEQAISLEPERLVAPTPVAPQPQAPPMRISPILTTAADLCTEFGRVRDLGDLKHTLGRAAAALDASGLVVWIGSTSGADLQPMVSHGYTSQIVARMPSVPRSADNAAAAAYRTGSLQIVLSRPGGAPGALVAPLLAADGCIGALSAEIRGGGEGSEGVQALATIFAAHLASVFAATAADSGEVKTVAQA